MLPLKLLYFLFLLYVFLFTSLALCGQQRKNLIVNQSFWVSFIQTSHTGWWHKFHLDSNFTVTPTNWEQIQNGCWWRSDRDGGMSVCVHREGRKRKSQQEAIKTHTHTHTPLLSLSPLPGAVFPSAHRRGNVQSESLQRSGVLRRWLLITITGLINR